MSIKYEQCELGMMRRMQIQMWANTFFQRILVIGFLKKSEARIFEV